MVENRIRDFPGLVTSFRTSNHWAVSLGRDLLWIVTVVGGIALILYLICGTWPALVAIESKSMDPHMKIGDLVVVVQKDRYGTFQTWLDGSVSNYTRYDEYGDVIIYRPNGRTNVTPIIHRAIQYVDPGPVTEIKGKKIRVNYTAIHPGYITWGDNNQVPDQFSGIPGIGILEPVKNEWIVGKALFTIPLIGYLPLNIWVVMIIVVIVMILHEIYLRSHEQGTGQEQKSLKKHK
jgi:signal peptidase